ncbi:MAG: HMA2 domain-containing protein [Methylohalobius sp.]
MTASAYLSHVATGRVRVKVPERRGDEAYFSALKTALSARSDIQGVQASARTGSVLLLHDGSLDLNALAKQAKDQGWFQLDLTPPASESLSGLISRQLDRLDHFMRRFSGSRLDNPPLIFLALTVLAVRQIAKGQVAPPAATTLWYLYELLQRQASSR